MPAVVLDLETYADEAAIPLLEPPSAPANYKDPEKIAAWQAEAVAKQRDGMALKPAECRIVAVGLGDAVTVCPGPQEEASSIRRVWNAWLEGYDLVGFNLLGFDLPVLLVRSQILRVRIPQSFRFRKYGMERVRDLMQDLDPGGSGWHGLGWWCRRLALDVPDDPTTGKDIAALVDANDWAGVRAHCQADLAKTEALFHHLTVT